jgi:hypothetical protein
MQEVIGVLSGAFLSGLASLSIGMILFRRLSIELARAESISLAFVAGAACFSQAIFALSSIHLARKGPFIALALLAAAAAFGGSRAIPAAARFKPLPRSWKWFAAALFAGFAIVYLVNAMAPEMSPDGAAYHLPFVDRYLRAHGFEKIAGDFYASLSQGVELLFMPAVSLGGHSSAALVHFLFLIDLPLMMICYGRRFGFPVPAMAAAFLVFASPIVGWDGTSAYVDVAAAAVLFATFYLLQIWDSTREPDLLIVIGVLAGFSYAVKYTAAIAVPYALGFVTWKLWRGRKPLLKPALTVASLAVVFILPWMIKNAALAGNPIAPFGNRLFPNPYVHVSFEQGYRAYLHRYHLTSWLRAPWELAVKGERLQGFFGPVFLLAPLALLSSRRPAGRRLLLAGAVFALPWSLNIGTRFLIPALPPLALALALAVERPPWLLAASMIVHGFLSWYAWPIPYFDRYALRIAAAPWRAALRMESQDAYLARREPSYSIDRMIERVVPAGDKVFSFEPIPAAWTTREIVSAQNGAENEALADAVRTALVFDACQMRAVEFRFPPKLLQRVRAIEKTAPGSEEMWSVSEFQLLNRGKPLAANGQWRVTANPNPWDAQLVFDGRLATRWRSWESARPGMFLEADFGKPELLDEARLLVSSDALEAQVLLRGVDASGRWRDLSAQPQLMEAHVSGNLRVDAIRELRAHGIGYLLVTPAAYGANEFNEHPELWGLRLTGEAEGARLYRLDPDRASPEPASATATPSDPPVPPGAYDDTDPHMRLREPWTRDPQFQEAHRHTLTYSDLPGAAISLAFSGSAITYVFTGASNRGIAEVWLDGRLRGTIDLYSPVTAWKSRRRFEGLGPGGHVIEIRVTGKRNPQAAGCFVDLDALIVE